MGKTSDLQSTFLFARPSFIEGVARIADVSGSLNTYNQSRNGAEADARAIYRDWKAVGQDVRAALEELRAESAEPAKASARRITRRYR